MEKAMSKEQLEQKKKEIRSLMVQLTEAVSLIELMKNNMQYIEPEYDELDIKVNAFLNKIKNKSFIVEE
jgi:hypothetical protein